MKKFKVLSLAALAALTLTTSCVSKKELLACQEENKQMSANYQSVREELAAANAKAIALQRALSDCQRDKSDIQGLLDKSVDGNNVNISKLVDQINESNQYIRQRTS